MLRFSYVYLLFPYYRQHTAANGCLDGRVVRVRLVVVSFRRALSRYRATKGRLNERRRVSVTRFDSWRRSLAATAVAATARSLTRSLRHRRRVNDVLTSRPTRACTSRVLRCSFFRHASRREDLFEEDDVTVIEKSIALSVIVPTMHGVVYRDARCQLFSRFQISRKLSRTRTGERADEQASEVVFEPWRRRCLRVFFCLSLTPSLLPRSSLELFFSTMVYELRYCQRNRSRCSRRTTRSWRERSGGQDRITEREWERGWEWEEDGKVFTRRRFSYRRVHFSRARSAS